VQGYGPVEELLFFREIARQFQPDLIIETIFVGNDAEEAVASAAKLRPGSRPAADVVSESLRTRMRRLVRRSMVLQVLRLRAMSVIDRLPTWKTRPEPPLQSYAAHPAPRIADGLRISRDCVAAIADEASTLGAQTMVMLVPARFQVNDFDYGQLKAAVAQAGGELVRDAATERFDRALAQVPVPRLDLLPALRATPRPDEMFFLQTVHLTPRGHQIVADAMERFLREKGLASGL
jgi:SGNH hydrolase-like domain, acetyltransferase AlgX